MCSWTCFTKNSVLIFKSVNLILHRPTPIWGVSEGAQKVDAGPRLVSLSQHKEPHPQYLFDRTAYMTVCILYFILLFKSYQINEQIQDVENSFACCILISFSVHVIWFCHNSMVFYFFRNKTNLKLVSLMWYILVIKYCSNWKWMFKQFANKIQIWPFLTADMHMTASLLIFFLLEKCKIFNVFKL